MEVSKYEFTILILDMSAIETMVFIGTLNKLYAKTRISGGTCRALNDAIEG